MMPTTRDRRSGRQPERTPEPGPGRPADDSSGFSVDVTVAHGEVVLAIHGVLDLVAAPELAQAVEGLGAIRHGRLVFDYADETFIDGHGLYQPPGERPDRGTPGGGVPSRTTSRPVTSQATASTPPGR